ncbi:MAG: hypothetical protein A4S14_05905 [Proteobacteria bacterium SG_bin9]|nr:MAG: hypothetical protein A4S14_05905 [Proteobacteria bacterium SG_bin9]
MKRAKATDDSDAELARLATAPIVNLRKQYRLLFTKEPPTAFGPDLLRRTIAQRIQEKTQGGPPRATQKALDQLVEAFILQPKAALSVPRRIKPGSELVRTWKGTAYRVRVSSTGFAYEGQTYKSLSEIATLITGTKWNGPRFFGLRDQERANAS